MQETGGGDGEHAMLVGRSNIASSVPHGKAEGDGDDRGGGGYLTELELNAMSQDNNAPQDLVSN